MNFHSTYCGKTANKCKDDVKIRKDVCFAKLEKKSHLLSLHLNYTPSLRCAVNSEGG